MAFKNKKGDFASIIFIVIILFVIGVVFFFTSDLKDKIFTELEDTMESNSDWNATTAHTTLEEIHTKENSLWDYAFLALFFGYMIVIFMTCYATRISPVFFWIYGILMVVGLALAVIVSNTWQEMAAETSFATTLTYYPITNAILGTYFPTIFVGIAGIVMVLLFGKLPGSEV